MPVYNGEQYLRQALDSVLQQTLTDFEFIIVNDGSTDSSGEILAEYARSDSRIRIIAQTNAGMVTATNRACQSALGQYIARLDHDDICLPERLARQVAYLDAQSEVSACGTWAITQGARKDKVWQHPIDDAAIRCHLLFGSPLVHSSTMIRRTSLAQTGWYDPVYAGCSDYDLWVRLAMSSKLANLPEVLVVYRVRSDSLSRRYADEQQSLADRIRLRQLLRLGIQPSGSEIEVHHSLGTQVFQPTKGFVIAAEAWLRKLSWANQQSGIYPEPAFARLVSERWKMTCESATRLGLWAILAFIRSPLAKAANVPPIGLLRFGRACLKQAFAGVRAH